MLQNVVRFPDCKMLAPVSNASARRERPVDEVMRVRNRWPFTVTAGYAAMLSGEGRLRRPGDASSFVS
jgi:hypothetical protein